MSSFIAAAVQMTSGDDIAANIDAAMALMEQAVAKRASLIALPENVFYMRREGTAAMQDLPMRAHPGVLAMQQWAQQKQVWILIGSIRAREEGALPYNRSVLIAPDGSIATHYDKIHLFDVTLANGQRYTESSQAMAGTTAVVAQTPMAALGLSICYDVRFAALYRALAGAGAQLLAVPSAFTRPTGEAHWHILLRARAIENGCYVIAPAQCGVHPGGRETYGHSLIIDPWGVVLAEADGAHPSVITATIDTARVQEVRAQIPVLEHARKIAEMQVI